MEDNNKFELIICIVNKGFNEAVMEAAREEGARGGTIINARGTAKEDIESKYNITITPEKEIVLLVVNMDIRDNILHAIYNKVGLSTPGQGIAFSVPIDETVGLGGKKLVVKEETKEEENK